ncbi:hypothetical protein AAFF_G00347820 [Aldrovandia affinis]|uniref:PHD finger protein 12 n=1 Tax=Aldrovandia affinis TaxID=143900 RepID=A0AAD7SJW1_9TELE|nr:hypothetical protein AAFF_G00347820 [Aldrovandia affinis]
MWDKMETPTIVYDLDTSGGLMEQIQSLLAPPKSEDGEKRSRKPEKEARRSGRATNHDTCDSCREGGDLLCCDHCPAAFHLQCCNPPLSEEMLPPGDWMCHRCSMRRKREQRAEQVNGVLGVAVSKRSGSPAGEVDLGAVRLDGIPGGAGLRMAVAQLLIAAAMERNPTQFQLPNELTCTTALPGSSKRRRKEEMTGKNVKRPQHELDHNGLVPLPVKVCFTCSRSCRVAPLIQCDYCPLLFHMDCLDPPHRHANRQVDVPQPHGACCAKPEEHDPQQPLPESTQPPRVLPHRKKTLKVPDAIKSQYQSPPPMLAPAGIRNGELICNGIPEHPPNPHVTSEAEQQEWLGDVITLQCSIMRHLSCRRGMASRWDSGPTDKADLKPCVAPPEESGPLCSADRTAPPAAFSEACSTPAGQGCRTANGPTEQAARANGPLPCTPSPEPCKQGAAQHRLTCPTRPRPQTPPASAPGLPSNHVSGAAIIKTESSAALGPCGLKGPGSSHSALGPPLPHPAPPGSTGGQVAALMSRSVSSPPAGTRALTPPRAPQDAAAARLASPTPPSGQAFIPEAGNDPPPPRRNNGLLLFRNALLLLDGKASPHAVSPAVGGLFGSMKAVMEGDGELELTHLDERLIKLLAWQRIQQLLPPKGLPPAQSVCVTPPQTANTAIASSAPSPPLTEGRKSEVQARAVFYPLTGKGGAVNMCYRTLYIGTGADMDVCLTNYGHCNYVSGKHACIFYDENTKHYELLNYSEHGTTVDNVLYSCDFSEKSSPSPASNVVSKVQSIIRRCKRRKREEEEEEELQGQQLQPDWWKGAGWEGTALLRHGSYIKLGCLQFVFSVAEFAGKPPKDEPAAVTTLVQEGAAELDDKQTLKLYQVPVLRSNSVP